MKRLLIAFSVVAVIAAPTALAAGTLTGKYKTTIKGTTALGGALNGTWTLHFTTGHYTVAENGKTVIRGVDTVKANVLTWHDKSGPFACSATGKYKFKMTGKKLKFTKVSDSCAGREAVLKYTFTKL